MDAGREWLTIGELCERHGFTRHRVYDLSRRGLLPIMHVAGLPVRPYRIDAQAFLSLISAENGRRPRSLKTEFKQAYGRRRKEVLWPE